LALHLIEALFRQSQRGEHAWHPAVADRAV
jgi:hypothetical protein